MFWKFDLNTTSHVDKLLDKEDVTLHELMDEDDILQECKAQNRKLLDFLCQQHCMEELVNLITHEPPVDMDEKVRFKYPNTACELLTSDVPQINDKLGGDETLLNILYDFLDHEPPLNPLLASFFSKTIGNLIARKTEQVIAFLRKKDKFISLVLKHIDTSAMMDLLLRLISCVEPATLRQEVLNWLNEAKIIQRLVELIHSSQDEDRQSNASQTLCDIIRLSRDQSNQLQEVPEPDPLLTALESQECVEQLLKNMFDGEQTENCIVNGTQVLLTLLETRRSGVEGLMDSYTQGFERSYTVNSSILYGIEPRLKDFHQLLLSPPKKTAILTTIGVLEEPLGNARLHGSRLIAALLHTNTPSINQELCRLSTMNLLLDLFFKYTWNNFLHFQVELSIAAILSHSVQEGKTTTNDLEGKEEVLNGNAATESVDTPEKNNTENIMVTHLFQKCCLVQRILDAWEANDKIQAEGGMRRGNMGHLTRIANAVVQNMEKGPMQTQISEFIKELPEDCRGRWESFVEETLTETNRRNTVDLVSTHHLHSSSEDEDIESAFPNELSLQQAFSEYQIQQMTANFVDQFGFNDEEFADQDDNINAPFDRIAEINFNIDADDDSPNASLFEACCNERIQQFDDNEEEEDIWEEKEITYATQVKSRTRFGASQTSESSSKSDLENGDHDGSVDSEEEEETEHQLPPSSANTNRNNTSEQKDSDSSEGSGWTAVFEPVNSKPPAPCVAMDVGSSVWDSAAPENTMPEEKGWAKFTDFQPFCCSESGPRCSSPVDTESSDSDGNPKQSQDKSFSAASPCVWNVCVTRKAPLVASDSSSSGGSDSDEEDDKADIVTETISTGSGQETIKLTMDAKNEKAVFTSDADCMVIDKLTITDIGTTKASKPLNAAQHSEEHPNTAAVVTAGAEMATKDRKEEVLPCAEATLNGPA
ncbi:serine/threonine-protein phosphatase 6 regulatory subunit 2 [Rhea pennata]|uniref:serine/threonine-protein phosphatase 6 regulatory subunit 2 n=1 Tax=Rhea pennata TaxID=8795 RepID=UPI002E277533